MEPRTRKKKQNVRPFQTGTGQRNLSEEDRYAFDVAGFLILEGLLTNDQVRESRARLEATLSSPPSQVKREQNGPEVELLNVAECGGVLEDTLASDRLLKVMEELIWGNQIRLVASRAILRDPGIIGEITQGGLADPRRYTRYRSFLEGEMRCLMVSCLIALDDTTNGDGSQPQEQFPSSLSAGESGRGSGFTGSAPDTGLRCRFQREPLPRDESFQLGRKAMAALSIRPFLHAELAGL